eukprot:NODE_55_length_26219_cov_0.194908.p19 type:complete len:101 gc:universal NODE_55_length_26219_cov_0.194908:2849-3151(+)
MLVLIKYNLNSPMLLISGKTNVLLLKVQVYEFPLPITVHVSATTALLSCFRCIVKVPFITSLTGPFIVTPNCIEFSCTYSKNSMLNALIIGGISMICLLL